MAMTLGVAMADSSVGTVGWILEKFGKWSDLPTTADGALRRRSTARQS